MVGLETISTLCAPLIAEVADEVIKIIKDKSKANLIKKNFIKCLEEYLAETEYKLKNIKTLISGARTINFQDAYYPLKIRGCYSFSSNSNASITLDELVKVLKDSESENTKKRITIIGNAGSGKTMITYKIFLLAAHKQIIPIIIPLRQIEPKDTILDYIKESIITFNTYNIQEKKIYDEIIKSGKFLFILDGYDDIHKDIKHKRNEEINKLVSLSSENCFVITSRPNVGAEYLFSFDTFEICNLSFDDAIPFIEKQCKLYNKGLREKEIGLAELIKKQIFEKTGNLYTMSQEAFIDYFKSPLLLSCFILTFARTQTLPTNKTEFYRSVFETLFERNDRNGYDKINYDILTYQTILENFCYNSFMDNKYNYEERELNSYLQTAIENAQPKCTINNVKQDLINSTSILLKDGRFYSLPHKTMNEYFYAQYLSSLPIDEKRDFFSNLLKPTFNQDIDNILTMVYELDKEFLLKEYLLPNIIMLRDVMIAKGPSKEEVFLSFPNVFSISILDIGSPECKILFKAQDRYSKIIKHSGAVFHYDFPTKFECLLGQEFWRYFLDNETYKEFMGFKDKLNEKTIERLVKQKQKIKLLTPSENQMNIISKRIVSNNDVEGTYFSLLGNLTYCIDEAHNQLDKDAKDE